MEVEQRDSLPGRKVAQCVDDPAARVARRPLEANRSCGERRLGVGAARRSAAPRRSGRRRAAAQRTEQALRRARRADRRADVHQRRVPVVRSPAGTAARTRSSSSRVARLRGCSIPKAMRCTMRRTLVSSATSSMSNANARIAAAVYGPMPGQRQEGVAVRDGNTPPCRSTTARAPARAGAARASCSPDRATTAGRRQPSAAPAPRISGNRTTNASNIGLDALDLRLLQHELAHDDAIRVARRRHGRWAPAIVPIPIEQQRWGHARRLADTAAPMRRMPSSISSRATGVSASRK